MPDTIASNSQIVAAYRAKTPKSAAMAERAAEHLPSGIVHDGRYLTPYGTYVDHAQGPRKWDVDGNEYVDFFGGHGALLLGHNHPKVMAAVAEAMAQGTHFGANHIREVEWEPLNPARGDDSPKAATLWGNRSGTGPTGFLVQFTDGFSSPPHIHNVTYRGVVIRGLVHNDDPNAAKMWMPTGSFWTQPKGEVHITAAKGPSNVAYIEIDEGPYLVLPVEEAFDPGERPINVDPSNIVWLDASDTDRIAPRFPANPARGPKIALLWADPDGGPRHGCLIRLPAGFRGAIRSQGSSFHAIVIQGQPTLQAPGEGGATLLEPGSRIGSTGPSTHHLSNTTEEESILYIRTSGRFDVVPANELSE